MKRSKRAPAVIALLISLAAGVARAPYGAGQTRKPAAVDVKVVTDEADAALAVTLALWSDALLAAFADAAPAR
ncbi:MAG TPA: hypothetical protein VF588_05135 [Pyrinomonadaceae bacterium]|jgi:hypothetical protein